MAPQRRLSLPTDTPGHACHDAKGLRPAVRRNAPNAGHLLMRFERSQITDNCLHLDRLEYEFGMSGCPDDSPSANASARYSGG